MEGTANYCRICGARLEPGTPFCHACGTPVRGREEASDPLAPLRAPMVVTPEVMPLFDRRRRYYKYKWIWPTPWGEVYDEKATVIGYIVQNSDGTIVELREADNRKVSAVVRKKLVAISDTYEIKDGHERLLARVKHKKLAPLHPEVWLEDPSERRILVAQGDLFGFKFKVHDMAGALVAEIEKPTKSKAFYIQVLKNARYESTDYCSIVINSRIDRQLIVPFVVSIEKTAHRE